MVWNEIGRVNLGLLSFGYVYWKAGLYKGRACTRTISVRSICCYNEYLLYVICFSAFYLKF